MTMPAHSLLVQVVNRQSAISVDLFLGFFHLLKKVPSVEDGWPKVVEYDISAEQWNLIQESACMSAIRGLQPVSP